MKRKIKELIVVEGITDVNFLSTFIDADFLITSGRGIKDETIDYIKQASEIKGVILLLDPDHSGEEIRKIIAGKVKNVKHAFIDPKKAKKKNKLGVAEATKEEILRALDHVVTFSEGRETLSLEAFYRLGLLGTDEAKARRMKVENYFSLGHGSGKTIYKRLNALGITYEDIKKALGEDNG